MNPALLRTCIAKRLKKLEASKERFDKADHLSDLQKRKLYCKNHFEPLLTGQTNTALSLNHISALIA